MIIRPRLWMKQLAVSLPRTKCFTMSNSYFNIKGTTSMGHTGEEWSFLCQRSEKAKKARREAEFFFFARKPRHRKDILRPPPAWERSRRTTWLMDLSMFLDVPPAPLTLSRFSPCSISIVSRSIVEGRIPIVCNLSSSEFRLRSSFSPSGTDAMI